MPSLKETMAAKDKMRFMFNMSQVVLFTVLCLHVTFAEKPPRSSSDRWLSRFQRASAFLYIPSRVTHPALFAGRLRVISGNSEFKITLHRPGWTDDILLNVDSEGSRFSGAALGLYEGSVRTPCCGFKAIVKISSDGIGAFINTDNDTYIIEPLSQYEQTNSLGVRENRESGEKSGKNKTFEGTEHLCILYTANDVLNNNTNTAMARISDMWNDYHYSYENRKSRVRRSAGMTECAIHIVADDTFYREVGHSSVRSTLSEMLYLVLEADLIFRGTDFDGDGPGDNIGFYVTKVSIYTGPGEHGMAHTSTVYDYLNTFSKYDHSEFCLAVAFTSRDFAKGVVGLAWVASSSNYGSPGGICQRPVSMQSEIYSLNTAIVTTHNEGERMPAYKSVITLTHEFGHNFGSPHDSTNDASCTPDGDYGNFIMYSYATDGTKPNNVMFSSCSISYMFPVIKNKAWCFKHGDDVRSVCGNGITEEGEDCDCGTSDTCDDIDPCCTPTDVPWSSTDTPCTARTSDGSECSPVSSLCCDDQCRITTSLHQCRPDRDCAEIANCDGVSSVCPDVVPKPNGTGCDGGTKTCETGACKGSICVIHGHIPCVCDGQYNCYLCCKSDSVSECLPTVNHAGQSVYSHLGQSCDDRQGYCNGQGECILQDPGSALDRLHEVFSKDSIEGFKGWMKEYWYYVFAALVALAFLIALFVLTCRGEDNVHTSAYMHGQFGRIQREAELQKQYLERRKAETKASFDQKLRDLDSTNEMCIAKAVTRMMTFFPTAQKGVILDTLKSVASEEAAVRLMLMRSYPFRRVCLPQEMKRKTSEIPTSEASND